MNIFGQELKISPFQTEDGWIKIFLEKHLKAIEQGEHPIEDATTSGRDLPEWNDLKEGLPVAIRKMMEEESGKNHIIQE